MILLTAKADHISKIEGLETGAAAYVPKPFLFLFTHTLLAAISTFPLFLSAN